MIPPRRRSRLSSVGEWLARHPLLLPACILVVGAFFRFYNLNWDNGHQLHPDERWIYEVISGANNNPPLSWPTSFSQFFNVTPVTGSRLDPHFFAYGSLPFYLLAFVGGLLSIVGQHVPFLSGLAGINTYGQLPMLGRALSGILDLGTVVLAFLIARRIFGYWTGVVAMAFVAFTVLDIQLSHFYTVDTVLAPLVLAALYGAIVTATTERRSAYVWTGIAFGLAMATKTTALLLVIPLAAGPILQAWTSSPWPSHGSLASRVKLHYAAIGARLNNNLQWTLAAYVIGAFTFAVCEPYAILDRHQLISDITEQSIYLVSNNPPFEVPYTDQYAGTTPYVYQIANMLFWSLGLPLAIASFAGFVYVTCRSLWGHLRPDLLVLVLWVLPYFLFVGHFFAKFNRYMLPITPVIAICGAALLVALVRVARRRWKTLAAAALLASVGGSLVYSVAYMNIYANPNTRVEASRWIFHHIPAGTPIATEGAWDDPLPMDEQGYSGSQYVTRIGQQDLVLNLYDGEDQTADVEHKIGDITFALQHAKYLIMTSERMIGSIPKRPFAYPITTRYYQLLFSNRLNFRLVKVFQQHPQIGPLVVHDYPADESFHVYDHPIVRVWKRVAPISTAHLRHLLTTGLPTPPASIDPATLPVVLRPITPRPDFRLMLNGKQWAADQKGPTMDAMFAPYGFAMQHPIVVWLLVLELLGLIAFPFVFVVFRNLRDRGFVIAKTLGILLLGYLVWIAVATGRATYDKGVILVALAVLAMLAGALAYRLREGIGSQLRANWRVMLAGELVFLAGFAIFIWLRMWYPDLGHQFSPPAANSVGGGRMGEKQMELAYLNAIVRSRVFPPFDPFFAHGYINYYYYGFFLVGTLCKLTAIMPATGFNLAIATFFALLVGNVFSVGMNLTRRVFPGVMAAAFVGIFGNLNGAWQLIRGLWTVATVHSSIPILGGIMDTLSGLHEVLINHTTLPAFDYWESTRIVPPVGGDISEFPYFTFLFADLHPHLLAYPMAAATIALAVSFLRGGYPRVLSRGLAALMSGVLVGAIAVTNPWDFPTYLGIVAIGVLMGALVARRSVSWRLLVRPAGWLVGLGVLTLILYLPFKQSYQTVFSSGIGMTRDITPDLLQGGNLCPDQGNICPGVWHDVLVTPLRVYLEHFGFIWFVILSFLVVIVGRELGMWRAARRLITTLQFAAYYRDRLPRVWHAFKVARRVRKPANRQDLSMVWGMLVLIIGLLILGYYLLAFVVAVLGLSGIGLTLVRNRLNAPEMFVVAIVAVCAAISGLTQVFFVKDFLAGGVSFRMNTIFKFYNQVWLLGAIAAACSLYFFMDRVLRPIAVRREEAYRVRHWWRGAHASPVPISIAHSEVSPSGQIRIEQMAFAASGVGAVDDTQPRGGAAIHAEAVRPARPAPWDRPFDLFDRHRWWASALLVLAVCCLIYTYAGTVSRETYRTTWLPESSVPFTLDGMAFMKVAYPGDYAAINWLNGHVSGAPVIAEAAGTFYDWRSRVSMFTGLPTIVNGIHESEQRFDDELNPLDLCDGARDPAACQARSPSRQDQVTTLYNSPSTLAAWAIIRRYNVKYIYVGSMEKVCDRLHAQCYSKAGLAKFNRMVGHGLTVAYRHLGVTIYEVTA